MGDVRSADQVLAKGAIKSIGPGNKCVDKMNQHAGGQAGTYLCHGQGSNQQWMLTSRGELRSIDDLCLQPMGAQPGIMLAGCARGAAQAWVYDKQRHSLTSNGMCA